MVVRSLWAALGDVWVVGLLVGWIVGRFVVCWPVSWDVVVPVDMKSGFSMKVDCETRRQAGT